MLIKYTGMLLSGALIISVLTGCGSKEEIALDSKHKHYQILC
jgi:hypothetical protein